MINAMQLPDASTAVVSGLLDYMRNESRRGTYTLDLLLEIFELAAKYDCQLVSERIILELRNISPTYTHCESPA
jgi:hypothetical protein